MMFHKSLTFNVLLALSFFGVGCKAQRLNVAPPKASRADEVAAFKPVQPERWILPNGLTVLFLKDDELPVVRGNLFLRGGSLWAPAQFPAGATLAMGELMRQGGAGNLSADALDRSLEELSADVISVFGAEFGAVGFSSLTTDLDEVFEIFTKVLLYPRFEGDRTALWKGQQIEGIKRRIEHAETVASTASLQLLFGNSRYGRVLRERDVKALTKSDLVALHSTFVKPDGAIFVITGRIEREAVAALVEHHLGGWSARGESLPPPPPLDYTPKPGIYFIELPFSQATVTIGQQGVARLTPDYSAIDIFNEIFGAGGFGSRLMKRVRTELGLTYGIFGGISPGLIRGTNFISAQTKAASVGDTIVESLTVLRELQSNPPTDEELSERRASIKNSYVFNFESSDAVAGRTAKLELLHFPADYDQTYLTRIEGVTPREVSEVAKNRWDISKLVTVIVGNSSAYAAIEKQVAQEGSPIYGVAVSKLSFDQAIEVE